VENAPIKIRISWIRKKSQCRRLGGLKKLNRAMWENSVAGSESGKIAGQPEGAARQEGRDYW
jgi:hypothetical protein